MLLDQVIHECKKQNRKAQEEIYKALSPKIFSICLKYSRDNDEAKDNLQEIFLVLFDKISSFNFKGSFEGWVKRIAVNYCLLQYKNQKIFEIVSEKIPADDTVVFDDDDISLDVLLKYIQELPDRYRLVFNLYVLDDYSHKEIAEMLEITVGTSKSNLARAKMILKEKIESQYKYKRKG